MKNTHKQHRKNSFSLRERRVIYQITPPEGPNLNERLSNYGFDLNIDRVKLEKLQREKFDRMERLADLIVWKDGTDEEKEAMKDHVTRIAILSVASLRGDGYFDFLPDSAVDLEKLVDKAIKHEQEKLMEWKGMFTKHVNTYFDSVKKARELDRTNPFKEELKKGPLGIPMFSGDDGDAEYASAKEIDKAAEDISKGDIEDRLNAMVEISFAIVRSTDGTFSEVLRKYEDTLESIGVTYGSTTTDLYTRLQNTIADFPKEQDIRERKRELHRVLSEETVISINGDLLNTLKDALEKTRRQRAEAHGAHATAVRETMAPHISSVSRIGGNDVGSIVESSIDGYNTKLFGKVVGPTGPIFGSTKENVDGKLNFKTLEANLKIAGVDELTDVQREEIRKAAGITDATTPKFLEEKTASFIEKYSFTDGATHTRAMTKEDMETLLKEVLKNGGGSMRTEDDTKDTWKAIVEAAIDQEVAHRKKKGLGFDDDLKSQFVLDLERDFVNDLVAAWDREPLVEHLKKANGLLAEFTRGQSFGAFVLRARMPRDVADDLIHSGMGGGSHPEKGVRLNVLLDLSRISNEQAENTNANLLIRNSLGLTLGEMFTLDALTVNEINDLVKKIQKETPATTAWNEAVEKLIGFLETDVEFEDENTKKAILELVGHLFKGKHETISTEAATDLAHMLTSHDRQTGEFALHSERHCIETLMFLFLEDPSIDETLADKSDQALAKAKAYLALMKQEKVFVESHGALIVKDNDLNKFTTFLDNTMKMGTKAVSHIDKMVSEPGFSKMHWYGAGKAYLGQAWKDGSSIVDSVVERIKSSPNTLFNMEKINNVSKLRNQERAYGLYENTLLTLLGGRGAGKDILNDIVKDMERFDDGTKVGHDSKTATTFMQKYRKLRNLIRVGSYVKSDYESTTSSATEYNNLPPQLRYLMMWKAMRHGKQGILDSRKILDEYYHAPKAYTAMMIASDAFLEEPRDTLPDGPYHVYRKAIVEYNKTVPLPNEKVEAYLTALDAYHKAARTPGINTALLELEKNKYLLARRSYRELVGAYESARKNPNVARREYIRKYMISLRSEYHPDGSKKSAAELRRDKADHKDLAFYFGKVDLNEERSERNLNSSLERDFGLTINKLALIALSEAMSNGGPAPGAPETKYTRGSLAAMRWLGEDHRPLAREPLRLILGGPKESVEAFIDAYVYGTTRSAKVLTLDGIEKEIKFSAGKVKGEVEKIQALLGRHSKGKDTNWEYIRKGGDIYKNPFLKTFDAGVEALTDLSTGTMTNKLGALVTVAAAVWFMTHIWKKANDPDGGGSWKLARGIMVGVPMAVFANIVAQQITGKDYLGSIMLARSLKERGTDVAQFLDNQRENYAITGEPAGAEAAKEFLDPSDPIAIADLMQWRQDVDEKGYRDYEATVPPGVKKSLNIGNIMRFLPKDKKTPQDAYRVAFTVFEAYLNDVAFQNDRKGPIAGEKHVRENYLNLTQFERKARLYTERGDENYKVHSLVYNRLKGRKLTMMDLMVSESLMQGDKVRRKQYRTPMEKAFDSMQYAGKKVSNFGDNALATASVMYERGQATAESAMQYMKFRGPEKIGEVMEIITSSGSFVKEGVTEEVKKAIRRTATLLLEAKWAFEQKAGGTIEWTADKGAKVTLDLIHAVYLTADSLPVSGTFLAAAEKFISKHPNIPTASRLMFLSLKIEKNKERVRELSVLAQWKQDLKDKVEAVARTSPSSADIDKWILKFGEDMSILNASPNMADFNALGPYRKMMVYEEVKKRIYTRILARYMGLVQSAAGDSSDIKIVPIDATDWNIITMDELETKLLESFGTQILHFVGSERTWVGDLKRYVQSLHDGKSKLAMPADLAKWLGEWLQKHDSLDFSNTAYRVLFERFRPAAVRLLGKDKTAFNFYLKYLETIFTNVVMELAMTNNSGTADPAIALEAKRPAFTLAIRDATTLLDKLSRDLRSSSMDIDEIFGEADAEFDELKRNLASFNTGKPPPGVDPHRLSPTSFAAASPAAAEADESIDVAIVRLEDIVEKYEKNKIPANLPTPADLAELQPALQNASRGKVQELRDTMQPVLRDMTVLRALKTQADNERNADIRRRLQFFVNSGAAALFDDYIRNVVAIEPDLVRLEANKDKHTDKLMDYYELVRNQKHALDPRSEELADAMLAFIEGIHLLKNKQIVRSGKKTKITDFLDRESAKRRGATLKPILKTGLRHDWYTGYQFQGNESEFSVRFSTFGTEKPANARYFLGGHYGRRLYDMTMKPKGRWYSQHGYIVRYPE